jgi:hypothetical protein
MNDACAHAGRKVGNDVQQARLADACRSVNVEHRKRRFGRLQRHPEQFDLGYAPDEPAPPARRQQVPERAHRSHLSHNGRIGAEGRDDQQRVFA